MKGLINQQITGIFRISPTHCQEWIPNSIPALNRARNGSLEKWSAADMMYDRDRVTTGIALCRHMGLTVFCMTLCIVLFIAGCASPGKRSRRHSRGKLSDVMERASNDYEGERRMPEPEYPPPPVFHEDYFETHKYNDDAYPDSLPSHRYENKRRREISGDGGDAPLGPLPDDETYETQIDRETTQKSNLVLGLSGGSGLMKGSDFHRMEFGNLYIGSYMNDHSRAELYLGGALASIQETSDFDRSLDDGVSFVMFRVTVSFLP
jgi:hypothetical protein